MYEREAKLAAPYVGRRKRQVAGVDYGHSELCQVRLVAFLFLQWQYHPKLWLLVTVHVQQRGSGVNSERAQLKLERVRRIRLVSQA